MLSACRRLDYPHPGSRNGGHVFDHEWILRQQSQWNKTRQCGQANDIIQLLLHVYSEIEWLMLLRAGTGGNSCSDLGSDPSQW